MDNCKDYGGFSFCGVNIADLHLAYVPENKDTYVYRPAKYTPHEETFEGHDGGYFFGTTVKPKDFTLRCYYEGENINNGHLTRIFDVFRRGRTGKLIFCRRPWVWYNATVIDVDDTQLTNYSNGLIKISMRAYYPFGRQDQTGYDDDDENKEDLEANTGMLNNVEWSLSTDLLENIDQTLLSEQSIEFYNPGTETAHTAILIAGTFGRGIRITNETTGQFCDVVGGPVSDNDYLIIDGLSGKVMKVHGSEKTYSFINHDNGFIDLAPGYPVKRNIHVVGTGGNTLVMDASQSGVYPLTKEDIGKKIVFSQNGNASIMDIGILNNMILNSETDSEELISILTIMNVQDNTITLSSSIGAVNTTADVFKMNKLNIKKIINDNGDSDNDVSLEKLEIRFNPTFS